MELVTRSLNLATVSKSPVSSLFFNLQLVTISKVSSL